MSYGWVGVRIVGGLREARVLWKKFLSKALCVFVKSEGGLRVGMGKFCADKLTRVSVGLVWLS